MTGHVLIAGSLFRQPEQRTSKAGKFFVTATIRAKDGATYRGETLSMHGIVEDLAKGR